MPQKLEVFSANRSSELQPPTGAPDLGVSAGRVRDVAEIVIVFALILIAAWTPQGRMNALFSISAAACVVAFAVAGRWSARELGLGRPFSGVGRILLVGAVLCSAIALLGIPLRFAGPGYPLPLHRSWDYVVWALLQEFILQGIFFVRLEALLGGRRAMVASAVLFAVAHIPSPLLTSLAFVGGLIFCELFRRWRNLYALGTIHGALGLTIDASLPDHWLHHMRVGIGYLRFH